MSIYLSPAQIAERVGVPHDRVLDWISGGELSAVQVGRHRDARRPTYRVLETDLENFLLRRRTQPPAKPRRRKKRLPRVTEYV